MSVILTLIFLTSSGCQPRGEREEPPNVILISIDTLRRDHLGCYGYSHPTSPNIDSLAQSGAVFDNAVSTCSWTLPAHASLFTGLYPSFHGLQDDGTKLPPEIRSLAQEFRDQGYTTLAVVSHVYVSSEFGLDRGFDRFDDSLIDSGSRNPIAEEVVDRFLDFMAEAGTDRYFAFVHFFDPHWNYAPPPPFDTRFTDPAYTGPIDGSLRSMLPYYALNSDMPETDRQHAIDLYDGEIAYVDSEIGRMLEALRKEGHLENTVIVVTSDHGEEFKEHGRLGHERSLYGEQLQIPLIISGHRAFPAGSRRSDVVSLIDIRPTLLDLLGEKQPKSVHGRTITNGGSGEDRIVFAESIRFGLDLKSARTGRFKLIHSQQGDLWHYFDLSADPLERSPMKDHPTEGRLMSALTEYAMAAGSGWHMKLIVLPPNEVNCRAVVRTEGRIVNPRYYFSSKIRGRESVEFSRYELSPDGHTFSFDALVSKQVCTISFETNPVDAPVTFEVQVEGTGEENGLYLGDGHPIAQPGAFTLEPTDPRLQGQPSDFRSVPPGCYIYSVVDPKARAPKSNLSVEAIERLRSLGYIGGEGGVDE